MNATDQTERPTILGHPIVHVSHEVPDIPAAVEWWKELFGAGPFFLLERQVFDEVTHDGAPASWDHSAAFGQWGNIGVELQHTYETDPMSSCARRSWATVRHPIMSPTWRPIRRPRARGWLATCPGKSPPHQRMDRHPSTQPQ